jgi:hypothetical protein
MLAAGETESATFVGGCMKQLIARTLTSLTLVVMLLAATAQAQSTPLVIKVNIPFEFNLGDQTLPAGSYSLVQPLQNFVALRDARGQTIASAFTNGLESSAKQVSSKLTFTSVGGQKVLSEIWRQDSHLGQKLLTTRNHSNFAKRRSPEARETAEGSQP